ncbi:hypothetical protein DFJ73DRAFT_849242 [Zopfochytrium polystomum]|nr:hypothetical protein DFJ73DRAFT_849242 [Zopfochytrium polystomum]
MPLVLVTGVTGFIAAHVAHELLSNGYHVRGTLRSIDKGEYLKSVLPHPENLSFVVVKDLIDEGAFDEAVKGVDYVIHCASPFHYKVQDAYKDLINPAVLGTTGILKSVAAHAPSVKRVVITSSMAAVRTQTPTNPEGLSELDWNNGAVEGLEKQGASTPPGIAYPASKTLAERAAWDFLKESPRSFDLVACNPPFVYGPLLQKVTSVDEVNTSCKYIADYLTGTTTKILPIAAGFVDVRDVAHGHVRALTVPEAGGNRFILSGGSASHEELVAVLRKAFPDRTFPPAGETQTSVPLREINTKARKVLGVEFRTLEQTVKDTADSLIEKLKI